MTEKEKLEQVNPGVKESPSTRESVKQDLVEELKKPAWNDIPLAYKSWESSSLSEWSRRDVEYVYGEWKDDIIWAVLVDYSYYPGGWCWMEYWVKLFVKRWKETDMERIVYRDAYSSSRDDRSKAFKRIDKVEVKDDKVVVTVSSSSRTSNYTFYLKKPENVVDEQLLTADQQQNFKEHIVQEKERLLKQETRELGMMPSTYDLLYMQMPNPQLFDKKYDKAEIMDEAVDLWKWECFIVIKTQIDAHADSGKQYAWLKYKITPTSTELVDQQTAYQSELMAWKEIHMQAM